MVDEINNSLSSGLKMSGAAHAPARQPDTAAARKEENQCVFLLQGCTCQCSSLLREAHPHSSQRYREKKEKLSEAPSQHLQGVPGGVARRVALQWAGAARRPAHAKPFIAYLSHRIKT